MLAIGERSLRSIRTRWHACVFRSVAVTSSNVGSARYRPPNKLDLDHWLRVAEDRAHVTITCYMTIKRVSYVRPRIEYVSVLGCCDLLTSRVDTLRCATYSIGTITDIDGDSMQPRGNGIVTISMVSGSMYTSILAFRRIRM